MHRHFLVAACVVLSLASHATAQDKPIAFLNARLITCAPDSHEIEQGVLIIEKGKIVAAGDATTVRLHGDLEKIDCQGKTIIPGIIDTHSHVGGVAGADGSSPIQPDVRILDSINPADSGFRRVVAGGITTLNVMPGSGHLLSGQTLYIKPRKANTIEEMYVYKTAAEVPAGLPWPFGGIKMANGTNSLGEPPFSGTRGKSAALVRERFIKAQEYQAKFAKYEADKKAGKDVEAPDRDLALEALVEALEGKRIIHHHTHRADDIMTVLRLQQEFGFRVVLHHTSEAWKVASELADAHKKDPKFLGCSIILVDSPGGKLEAANMNLECGAMLEKAGVPTAIHTDDWINDSRLFMRCGAMAIRNGMTHDAALRALTIEGAKMLDLDKKVGSLEAGKDADFVILSGDPFSVYTKVEQTWIEGGKVFDRSKPEDALYAIGGFGAGRDQEPYMCCAPNGGFGFAGKSWGTSKE